MKNILFIIGTVSMFIAGCRQTTIMATSECETKMQQLEANKKMVADFYQALFGDKDTTVIDEYIANDYIQHNPGLADGRKALKKAAAIWFKDAPKDTVDIRHIGADGDLVYLHSKGTLRSKPAAIVDIFRIDRGKIAEHWDVIQEIPDSAANDHPMF